MATAVNTLVAEIRKDFPQVPAADVIALLQEEDDILSREHRITVTTESVNLTAGTSEYSVSATTARYWAARYVTGSGVGAYSVLHPTKKTLLFQENPNWLKAGNGTPRLYYIDAGNLGLYPPPDTTTSGGYPKVVLEVSQFNTITAGQNMPSTVRSFERWKYGVLLKLALRMSNERVQLYSQMKKEAEDDLREQLEGREVNSVQTVKPRKWRMRGTRV